MQSEIAYEINKILDRNSMDFYLGVWKQRNNILHDSKYYKSCFLD